MCVLYVFYIVNRFLYNPWKFMLVILLWSNLGDVKGGFLEEKCVDEDFVRIIKKLKDSWVLGKWDYLSVWT